MSIVWRDRAILARTAEAEAEETRREREIALAKQEAERR